MKNYTVKVFEDGSKVWLLNGERHREDGPAIEFSSGTKAWYLNGEKLTEKEHMRRTSKVTMEDALEETDRLRAKKKQIYEDLQDPVEREWVGLTDEEIEAAGHLNVEGESMLPYSFARAIEAKLKEKNA